MCYAPEKTALLRCAQSVVSPCFDDILYPMENSRLQYTINTSVRQRLAMSVFEILKLLSNIRVESHLIVVGPTQKPSPKPTD